MSKLFISHSSQDDGVVRELRAALANHGIDGWIDSRELRGGDLLSPAIKTAIEGVAAYAVVISTDSLQSKWVGRELRHALEVQRQRGKDKFPVIPLSLNETKLGVLEEYFDGEPIYISVTSSAGGIEAAVNAILVATGKRLNADVAATIQPKAEPLEELVLELSDLEISEEKGVRRAAARARLVYQPATLGQPEIHAAQMWRFTAPIGPIEAGELSWYLEKYSIWPSHYFRDRAAKVEENLVKWGRELYEQAISKIPTLEVMKGWAKIADHAGRRFSVHVDQTLEVGAPETEISAAKEAATLILGLPWELLHDGKAFLFQGARAARVRRRLPGTEVRDVSVVATPIRILLVTARPEDDACGYIDHRASALPLVEAMETLPGLVQLHVLSPPTLSALSDELDRARRERQPYHVVHFDGHGVYDRSVGLGGLCFEHADDIGKLDKRRHVTVFTSELGPLLSEHRIPLVFLEACQTAMSEKASESVASELLKVGVASVVAMSHSVLVETARRFVEAFYQALARGARVGDAMLDGQRKLYTDKSRGRIFGVGELKLHDWFVPVLFQEKEDPQLFRETHSPQTKEDSQKALNARLGALADDAEHGSPKPKTGFIGRSRELLALQRLLRHDRYAVVRGQGGEGKTTLAAEFARWMVRSQQMRRAAFVSVEIHGNERAVVDALGKQIVARDFSAAGDLEEAILKVERALREQSTVLVLDNMESTLLPPYLETSEALSEEAGRELRAILALAQRLLQVGETRLVFTSREALPAPFDDVRHRRELHRLDREDAVKLVERALNAEDGTSGGAALDAAREAIEALVDAVHGHARTLALLAPALRRGGVDKTREDLVRLMEEMDRQFPVGTPESREKSVFASVELSLRRMSPANRDKARVVGVFHGGVRLQVLMLMMQWDEADVVSLAGELIATGLATPNRYNHLTLNPALCPYLRGRMDSTEREALTARWVEAMRGYAGFLYQQSNQNAEVAATLTLLELRNLFALLDIVPRAGDAEATIDLATSLYSLLHNAGKPRVLERVGHVRDAAAAALGDAWNHARFEATKSRIEQQLVGGQMRQAFEGAKQLLQRAQAAGPLAYPSADYDLAVAYFLLARVLKTAGGSEQALPLLDEARRHFKAVADEQPNKASVGMASACFMEQGDCLLYLGRLNEAAAAYEEAIRRSDELDDARQVAVGKVQLGTVRMNQRLYPEALAVYAEACERFTQLDEPGSVATIWHQTGIVFQQAGQPEAAEDAYRKSLAIKVRLGNVAGQASTLSQLGTLSFNSPNCGEEAASFFRQSADKYAEIRDAAREGVARSNLAEALRELRRLEEARQEIRRATRCKAESGHMSEPWKTWAILADIETDAGNPAAAVEANLKAIACYLAYRRDGGENHSTLGRLFHAATQALNAGQTSDSEQLIAEYRERWKNDKNPEADVLQAIVAGRRDRTLADAPDLSYSMAAEILFLLETLDAAGR